MIAGPARGVISALWPATGASSVQSKPATAAPHRVGDVIEARRVVVVRKTTVLEQHEDRPDSRLAAELDAGGSLADRIAAAHGEHVASFRSVVDILQAATVDVRVVARLTRRDARWADLVVTVGGDGTFLRASHCIDANGGGDGTPMLGVNSATSSSVGFFCAATAGDFGEVWRRIRDGEVRTGALWRMRVLLNGRSLPDLALNDVLFAHHVPAETTRYSLAVDGHEQHQASSGLWIATAAGSTAAIRSAGGEVKPLLDRRLQFRVRELLPLPLAAGRPLIGGTVEQQIEIICQIRRGVLYVDGGHHSVVVGYGDRILLQPSSRPMPWVAADDVEQRRRAVTDSTGAALAAAGYRTVDGNDA